MKLDLQANPRLTVQTRGCACNVASGSARLTNRVVPGLDHISTWLYDVVDRRARETFETLSIRACP
jgi:hypothetical protein